MPNPQSTAQIAGHPIHPMLIPFLVVFFHSFCHRHRLRDNRWWGLGNRIEAGVIMALVAAVFGFTDFLGSEQVRNLTDVWLHMIGNLVAVVLAAINWYLRYSTAPTTGVFPAGFWISLATVLLLLLKGWKGWELVYRHHVGVAR